MNLQQILIDAGAGFALGMAFGLKGYPEKSGEQLELYSLIPEEKLEHKLTDKQLKNWKKSIKMMKITLPISMGGVYSSVSSLFSQEPYALSSGFAVAVPSAYLGRFVGAKIRKLKNRKKFEMEKNEIKASLDFPNAYKYLLPKDRQEILENAFSELEQSILNGDEEKINDSIDMPLDGFCKAITESKTKYTGLLLKWGVIKQKEIFCKAFLQRNIKEFYDEIPEDLPPPYSSAHCAIMGNPDSIKIKVFTKQGGDFYIQTMEVPNLKIVRDDNAGILEVEGDNAKVTSTDREIWTDDYRALADRFIYESKGDKYTMMLLEIPIGLPSEASADIILANFLPAYEKYHRHKKEEKW